MIEPDVLDATIVCPDCFGSGEVTIEYGFSGYTEPLQVEEDCPACGGSGQCKLGNLDPCNQKCSGEA